MPVQRNSQTTIRSAAGDAHSSRAASSSGRRKSFRLCSLAGATTAAIGLRVGSPFASVSSPERSR
jgi:hypothetical protein